MSAVVADTHTVLWYLTDDPVISPAALTALDQAAAADEPIFVPSICIVETTYLVEKGRVPAPLLVRLDQVLAEGDFAFRIAPLTLEVAVALRWVPRDAIPDLPDRAIAATALSLGLPLVTRDEKIRASGIKTIW